MTKYLKPLGVALAVLALAVLPSVMEAQSTQIAGLAVWLQRAEYIGNAYAAADISPQMYIKFYGPGGQTGTTTVAVEADGNLTFVADGSAYAGFECPVSGDLGGIIDVSNAACNTAGEVIDIINATATSFTTGYFRAALGTALRTDTIDANTSLADAADTEVSRDIGEVVFWDTGGPDNENIGLWDYTQGALVFLPPSGGRNPRMVTNPFEDSNNVLLIANGTFTNAGTAGTASVYCVKTNARDGQATSSEVVQTLFSKTSAATTVLGSFNEFQNNGGLVCNGGKLFVRTEWSGADTSVWLNVITGYRVPRKIN